MVADCCHGGRRGGRRGTSVATVVAAGSLIYRGTVLPRWMWLRREGWLGFSASVVPQCCQGGCGPEGWVGWVLPPVLFWCESLVGLGCHAPGGDIPGEGRPPTTLGQSEGHGPGG